MKGLASLDDLPEEMIQSFMELKLAAQASSLSKTWYTAWCTRPNICLDPSYFHDLDGFRDFATKTVQRSIHLNVKVDNFVLRMHNTYYPSLVDKLIFDALKLNMNVFHFSSYHLFCTTYVLPAQVFANKYLTELRLDDCKIDCLIPGTVLCTNLRSLSLDNVSIDDSTFKTILARCPVIQHLNLVSHADGGLTRIRATELCNLESLVVGYDAFWSPHITSSVICGRYLNLSRLVLRYVTVDESFFTNISSSFPKLEDLTLEYVRNKQYIPIHISSHSITVLSLKYNLLLGMAKFDVPNIRKFEFEGTHIPALSFTASSKEWSSKILLAKNDGLDLSKLRELLINLRRSNITLHLCAGRDRNVAPERNIENFTLPPVEELTFSVESCESYRFYVECLLCCRPKLVSLHFCSDYWPDRISNQYMYEKLIERTQNSSSLCPNELEEVNVELYAESLKQWQPIKTLSDDFKIPYYGADTLRFKLKWGSLTPEYTIITLTQYYHVD